MKTAKLLLNIAAIILLCIGLVSIFVSSITFYKGFHNVDLSYNMCLQTNDVNQDTIHEGFIYDHRNMTDRYDLDKEWSVVDMYITGHKQMELGYNTLGIGMLCIIGAVIFFPEQKRYTTVKL